MAGLRIQRLSKQILKDLSEIFLKINRENFKGVMISVTEVRLTNDLSLAKVFLSVFPSNKADEVITQVNSMVSQIRFELGKRLRHTVRKIPELNFILDPTFDNLEKIDNLLKDEKKQQNRTDESEENEK